MACFGGMNMGKQKGPRMGKAIDPMAEFKAYIDEVLAKTKATRMVQVSRTIAVPSPMPSQAEYVKFGFFEEVPVGKTRLQFAHELEADLNVLIGEAKAEIVKKTETKPALPATPPSTPPEKTAAISKDTPDVVLEGALEALNWSVPNAKGYQWIHRAQAERIPIIKGFIGRMTEKWTRQGRYTYIISGVDYNLLGRMPLKEEKQIP